MRGDTAKSCKKLGYRPGCKRVAPWWMFGEAIYTNIFKCIYLVTIVLLKVFL